MIVLPLAEAWSPEYQKRLNDALEERFSVLNEYALVPYGGTQGQVLAKLSDRPFEMEWSTAAGGGGTWGSITGTLSAQTDLQAALDAKLSTSGGTVAGNLTINGTVFNASDSYILAGAWIRLNGGAGFYTNAGDYLYTRGDGWNLRGAATLATLNYLLFQDGGANARGYISFNNATMALYSYASGIGINLSASGTYGSIHVTGSKNAYAGISFASANGNPNVMFDTTAERGGIYAETGAGWWLYWNGTNWLQGNNTAAIPFVTWGTRCVTSRGTGTPTGGADGDVYYQYT